MRRSVVLLTAIFVLGASLIFFLGRSILPQVTSGLYRIEDRTPEPLRLPLAFGSQGEHITVDVLITIPAWRSVRLAVRADDCLDAIFIDGQRLDAFEPVCRGFSERTTIPLPEDLSSGVHAFRFEWRDTGGAAGFDLGVSPLDSGFLFLLFLSFALGLWYLHRIATLLRVQTPERWFIGTILLSVLLRCFYWCTTPFFVRSHEWDKHVDYIRYVAEYWRIPPAAAGWEFHQPPLYYALAALSQRIGTFFGFSDVAILSHLHLLSFILGLLSIALIVWVSVLLFPRKEMRLRTLFFSVVAFMPSLIFPVSRISNDALAVPLGFVLFGLLFLWWNSGSVRAWYALIVSLAVGMLTKLTALVFVPVLLCLLGFRLFSKRSWQGSHVLLGALLFMTLFAWYPAHRFWMETSPVRTVTLGNLGMDPATVLDRAPESLLTFNPIAILQSPYNSPADPSARRMFPEYFYTSAFFGEFHFPVSFRGVSFLLLLFGMFLFPYIVAGCISSLLRFRDHAPILLLTLSILSAAFLYRFLFSFAPNQDFRFSVLLMIPIAWFLIRGIERTSGSLRRIGETLLIAEIACAVLFIAKIVFL